MLKHWLVLAPTLLVALPSGVAVADISKTESFERSAKTSLKVLEPTGAKVSGTVAGVPKQEEVPAIFSLPDEAAYLVVKVTMPDGETWAGKVEIKARHQTVVRFVQGKKGAQPSPAKAFSGRLLNTSGSDACDVGENLRFKVSRNGREVFTSQLVFPGRGVEVALEAGTYAVSLLGVGITTFGMRAFVVKGEAWTFASGCVKED
jgi:hypothetical protein